MLLKPSTGVRDHIGAVIARGMADCGQIGDVATNMRALSIGLYLVDLVLTRWCGSASAFAGRKGGGL